MLRRRARLVRTGVTAALVTLLLIGTLFGGDDHFPFGPMRMYSTTSAPTGPVRVVSFEGVTDEGKTIRYHPEMLGIRPAEIEGQMDRLRSDPGLLRHLATAHERMSGGETRLVALRLIIGTHSLQQRKAVSYDEEVVATWSRR
jgi:hypothetical protein